jgi:hypothetical protein
MTRALSLAMLLQEVQEKNQAELDKLNAQITLRMSNVIRYDGREMGCQPKKEGMGYASSQDST